MANSWLLAFDAHIMPLGPKRAPQCKAEAEGKDEYAARAWKGARHRRKEHQHTTDDEHDQPVCGAPTERIPTFLELHGVDVVPICGIRKTPPRDLVSW